MEPTSLGEPFHVVFLGVKKLEESAIVTKYCGPFQKIGIGIGRFVVAKTSVT